MKLFKTKESGNSCQLFNEKEELVGELLFGFIAALNDRIKIGEEVYKIKYPGFLLNGINVFDQSGKLVVRTDSSKNRIFYYGNHTEVYTYQYKGWLSKQLNLYNSNDKLLVSLRYRQTFFKMIYNAEIDEDFNNTIGILTFLNFYTRALSSG
ncbi:hypothetical protein CLU96_3415 [Chryseobacterium sp. 52]|uniref:hypothetical protein n=1 Tax=Chryseobacterium sp. 52 TaxID=2035213 RepID=UPI000C177817|nr:hypothetical protein [Chryseobacterium sp. 52]PIF46384.1 hypothetical protein CLU96_3415 [Chryseobacterium sp. 52]